MVTIPAGSFLMGNNGHEGFEGPEEFPQHSVNLPAYQMGKYEVTRGQFRKFIETGGYTNSSYWSAEGWKWKESDVIDYAGMHGAVDPHGKTQPSNSRATPRNIGLPSRNGSATDSATRALSRPTSIPWWASPTTKRSLLQMGRR